MENKKNITKCNLEKLELYFAAHASLTQIHLSVLDLSQPEGVVRT